MLTHPPSPASFGGACLATVCGALIARSAFSSYPSHALRGASGARRHSRQRRPSRSRRLGRDRLLKLHRYHESQHLRARVEQIGGASLPAGRTRIQPIAHSGAGPPSNANRGQHSFVHSRSCTLRGHNHMDMGERGSCTGGASTQTPHATLSVPAKRVRVGAAAASVPRRYRNSGADHDPPRSGGSAGVRTSRDPSAAGSAIRAPRELQSPRSGP